MINKKELRLYKDYSFLLIFVLFIFQLIGFMLIIPRMDKYDGRIIYAMLSFIVLSIATSNLIPRMTKGEFSFILIVNILYSIGVMMITRLNPNTGFYHLVWYLIGIFVLSVFFPLFHLSVDFLRGKYHLFFFLTLACFFVTFIFGQSIDGAMNWIKITESISIQPSEFAKVAFIVMIACYYQSYERMKSVAYGKYYLMISTYIFVALFFLQGELGTAMVFFALFISSTFVFEKRYGFIFVNILLAILGLVLAYLLFSHIRVRFEIYGNPWVDPENRGYQIIQSLFAIASGGMFGSGLGLGSPRLIPVASSDFILSAIMEEMGIFMGISIALLYIIFVYKAFKIAILNRDIFYSSLAFSIGIIISGQALIMFGGVLGLIPLTGITTPFLSYGGSSTISNFILLAILQYASSGYKKVYYEKN